MKIDRKPFILVSMSLVAILGVVASVCWTQTCMKQTTLNYSIEINKLIGKGSIIPIAVIGSGPAGLSAAIYGARANMHTVVFEGDKPGGLLTETTEVANWPGEISILGPDIIAKIRAQAQYLGAQFVLDTIKSVDFGTWPFILHTQNGDTVHALSVIIATGAKPRTLGVPGERNYWGRGVTTCAVCDAPFFKNENVVVVGGGDSAVEEAIQLARFARSITILVRKGAMRAAFSMQERLKAYKNISVKYNVEVKKINGDGTQVTSIDLLNNKTNIVEPMPISGVFLAIGHDPNTQIFKSFARMDDAGYIKLAGRSQETSTKGIFAAGDVEDHQYRQAGVASGSGIKAALDAIAFLNEISFNTHVAHALEASFFSPRAVAQKNVQLINRSDDFNALVKQEGLVVADFFTDYCPSCMQMLPVFASIAQDFVGKARFVKIDADQAEDIVRAYSVIKVPCLLVFKDGALVARYSNVMNRQELKDFVGQFLG